MVRPIIPRDLDTTATQPFPLPLPNPGQQPDLGLPSIINDPNIRSRPVSVPLKMKKREEFTYPWRPYPPPLSSCSVKIPPETKKNLSEEIKKNSPNIGHPFFSSRVSVAPNVQKTVKSLGCSRAARAIPVARRAFKQPPPCLFSRSANLRKQTRLSLVTKFEGETNPTRLLAARMIDPFYAYFLFFLSDLLETGRAPEPHVSVRDGKGGGGLCESKRDTKTTHPRERRGRGLRCFRPYSTT